MIGVTSYLAELTGLLQEYYGTRLLYVGLQGSYLRGEANEQSDIDIMVVIDDLTVSDLSAYRKMIESMEHFERSCGFICSKTDLASWNPLEICHILHSTKDYYGTLSVLAPNYTDKDVRNFVKLSVNNLYHEICHRYIHGEQRKNVVALPSSYKGVFFILQNLYYLKSGKFISTKAELLKCLTGKDKMVLQRSLELTQEAIYDFYDSFELLFTWCQETLQII